MSSTQVQVRLAVAGDVHRVHELREGLIEYKKLLPIPEPESLAGIGQIIDGTHPPTNIAVASIEPTIVGMVIYNTLTAPVTWSTGAGYVYIEDMFVSEDFRRSYGVGRALFRFCARQAIAIAGGELSRASLRFDTSAVGNGDSIAAFETMGFTNEELNYRAVGQQLELVMA